LALCIVTLVSKTVNLTGHLTLVGSPTGSEYRFSCEPCPPSSKDYLPGSCRHLTLDQHSVPTRSLPGGYRHPIIQPGFLVTGPSFQSLNKITNTFLVSECFLHVGQVGNQNYDRTVSPAGPSRGTL
ncbi:hypothetical protein CHARACLAT_031206, partial [Characodon lateralis]|nr:hypothetical protein [Characodon lateralis]